MLPTSELSPSPLRLVLSRSTQWWFSCPSSLSGREETPLYLWRIQRVLQIRLLQSASPSPLHLNLSIIFSTSLFHQDKLNRSRVCQGGVADMAQLMAYGTKSVSFPITKSRSPAWYLNPVVGFVNAQYRFVLNPLGDYTVHFADPDM